jgi:hypothetical protein
MEEEIKEKVESISDLLNILKELSPITEPQPNLKGGRFFRGQAKYEWDLLPSLYRENLFQYERVLINETLHKCPDDFKNLDTFSTLVKMQHYGMKTRLLDLSENPLVALYFSCNSYFNDDGAIYIINNAVTHYSHDLLVQVTMDYIFNYAGYSLVEEDAELLFTPLGSYTKGRRPIKKIDDLLYDLTLDSFCIVPKLNNRRLIAQKGAFLCFGMDLESTEISDNPGTFGKKYFHFTPAKIRNVKDLKIGGNHIKIKVPNHAKEKILKELNILNINKGSLFLDLEHQISDIYNSIKKTIS